VSVLGTHRAAGGLGELPLALSTVRLGLLPVLHPAAGGQPYYLSPRLSPPLSGHFFDPFIRYRRGRCSGRRVSARTCRGGRREPSRGSTSAGRAPDVPITVGVMIATRYGRFHYVPHTRRRGPGDRRRHGVSIPVSHLERPSSGIVAIGTPALVESVMSVAGG
jgi:hypothetical protein